LPISRRYLISSTFVLLVIGGMTLIGVVAATVWLSERAQTYAAQVEQHQSLRNRAFALREAMLAAESSQRGYVLTSNVIYLAPYESAKNVASTEFLLLDEQLSGVDRFLRMKERLRQLIDQRFRELDAVIELTSLGNRNEALERISTNEGKALMDEAQVFINAVVLHAEDALNQGLQEQTANTAALRLGTILASILILIVVAATIITFIRYTREIAQARDALADANAGLETRVMQRTDELVRARDRAEILLTEVNHRVANSLSFVGALISLQRQAVQDPKARSALDETRTRIQAVAQIHKHLYTSSDVTTVSLDEYMRALLTQLEQTLTSEGHGAAVHHDIVPVRISTSAGINLGIVISEWVTNAFKYAYGGKSGDVRVRAWTNDDNLHVSVEDDGIGMSTGPARGTGVGSKIVATVARSLRAEINYVARSPGTEAHLVMPLSAA